MSAPTPGERERKIAADINRRLLSTEQLAQMIADCSARARQEQREKDARIAEGYERAEQEPQYKIIAREIAAAIRRRGHA